MLSREIMDLVHLAKSQLTLQKGINEQLLYQLDNFDDQLSKLNATVKPLCASSQKVLVFGQNLTKMQELTEKLRKIEQQNEQLMQELSKPFSESNFESLQLFLSNRRYLVRNHPDYPLQQMDKVIDFVISQINQQLVLNPVQLDFLLLESASTNLYLQKDGNKIQTTQMQLLKHLIQTKFSFQQDPVFKQLSLFIDLPRRFYYLLKQLVQQKRVQFLQLINQFQVFGSVLVKQQTQLKIEQKDFCQFSYIELIRELEIQTEPLQQDEYEQNYKLRAQSEQKMTLSLNQLLNGFMNLPKKQTRKMFNTQCSKHFYTPPKVGYQIEQHPLMSLFTLFTQKCYNYKLQLQDFFQLSVRYQLGFDGTGELSTKMQEKVDKLVESTFVDTCLQAVVNLSCIITEYLSGQQSINNINALFDLVQFFNSALPIFMQVFDFTCKPDQHLEMLITRNEIPNVHQLSQKYVFDTIFEQQQLTPCKLIKLQLQKTFQYMLKCALKMQSQMDYILFQPVRFTENTLVVPQTSVILSQLQQLQQFTSAWNILSKFSNSQLKKVKSQFEDESDQEQPDFDFSKTHLNFQLTSNNSLEQRILYMLNLVTQQPNSEIYLLQKLNTVGYIYEYFQDIGNQISNLISQSLKDFTLHLMYSLVQQYRVQIWEPVCRRLKPNLLGEALVNVFQKWAEKRQFGITMLEVQQIKQQITGFQTRKEQINIKAQDENEKIDELSGESTIQGLDIDQVTESGFSVNDTEVQQKFKVNNSKVKSKRIKTIINDNLNQFYKQFEAAMKLHKGFYCISRNLNKKLKQTIEQTAFSQLEFYQNVCYATMVSQRYFEEDQKEGMQGLVQRVKDVFGE